MIGTTFLVMILFAFSSNAFASTFIIPTHDEILDSMSLWDRIKYDSKTTSFSILTEPEDWTCTVYPTSTGIFTVPASLGYTVSCGGDALINLYLADGYKFIREDISPYYYHFVESALGNRYIFECYSCTPAVSACEGINCPSYCAGTTRYSDGYCNEYAPTLIECLYGDKEIHSNICGYVTPDICDGIDCPEYCDDVTLYYDGYCNSNYDGTGDICEYKTETQSTTCGYISPDITCEGVSCPSYCENMVLYDAGHCVDDVCEYTVTIDSEICGYVDDGVVGDDDDKTTDTLLIGLAVLIGFVIIATVGLVAVKRIKK